MRTEQKLIRQFSTEIAKRITRKTISALQKLDSTLSGDGSILTNVWDEYCVQVQAEESFFWDSYQDLATSIILNCVEDLSRHEKIALYFQTDNGWNWPSDHIETDNEPIPYSSDEIVNYIIRDFLHHKAGKWSNFRIRQYLDY